MNVRAIAIALCMSLAPSPTRADDAALQAARSASADGIAAFSAGRYAEAERRFLDAYQLVPQPALLYNLARCRAALGRDLEAAETYEAFARLSDDEGERAEAETMAIEARHRAAARRTIVVATPRRRYFAPAATVFAVTTVALGAAGLGTGLAAQSTHDDLDRRCAMGCPADAPAEARSGDRLRIASIATLAIGGAALLAGAVAFGIEWRRRPR